MSVVIPILPTLLRICAAPALWFAHLCVVYAITTLTCPTQAKPTVSLLIATAMAFVLLLGQWKMLAGQQRNGDRWNSALTALATLAVGWTGLAALLSPPGCS